MTRGLALRLSILVLSLGCFRYVPAALETVPVGSRLRALISTEAQLRLRDSMGLDARELRGTLVEQGDGHLLLQVRTGSGSPELGGQPLEQRIVVSPGDLLRVDVRRLSPFRTGLTLAVFVGAATVVVYEAFVKGNPGTPEPPPGSMPEQIVR